MIRGYIITAELPPLAEGAREGGLNLGVRETSLSKRIDGSGVEFKSAYYINPSKTVKGGRTRL